MVKNSVVLPIMRQQKKRKNKKNLEKKNTGEVSDNNESKISVYCFPQEENKGEKWVNIIRRLA